MAAVLCESVAAVFCESVAAVLCESVAALPYVAAAFKPENPIFLNPFSCTRPQPRTSCARSSMPSSSLLPLCTTMSLAMCCSRVVPGLGRDSWALSAPHQA